MLILTFDQSITQTGYATFAGGNRRLIQCGSFTAKVGKDDEEKCEIFAVHVKNIISKARPDFIIWERARKNISGYEKQAAPDLVEVNRGPFMTVNAKQLLLPEIQGIIRGEARAYGIEHESVSPGTWRVGVLGKGTGKLSRPKAKAAAKEFCKQFGIKASNENEAEAACIACWGFDHSQKFKMMRYLDAGVVA